MTVLLLLACAAPVDVEVQVMDGVFGAARDDVRLMWRSPVEGCTRAVVSSDGRAAATLCPDVPYDVEATDPWVTVWPPVAGTAEMLPATVAVVDTARGLALVGGDAVPLPDTVDVRHVQPRGHDGVLPIPAIVPVALPRWTAAQALFVPSDVSVAAVPVVPTGEVALAEGGPLQPWFALGASVDGGGAVHTVSPVTPSSIVKAPGGAWWMDLPDGVYALWDGEADRVPLLEVARRTVAGGR